MKKNVLILDFGSQYTKLIARRIRELRIYCEIHPFNMPLPDIKKFSPGAIILSGGPSSVYDKNAPHVDSALFDLNIPVLGICYGLQIIAVNAGMKVIPAPKREYGFTQLEVIGKTGLLKDIRNQSKIWMSHGDKIQDLNRSFSITAKTPNTEIAAIESPERQLYGVQFHPEVVHTEEGKKILSNFVFSIAALEPNWDMKNFINAAVKKIRDTVGNRKVILGLSGGVDSTVLALLLKKAIGDQLFPVFIDTGLLRKDEFKQLMKSFKEDLQLNVTGVDASKTFLTNLRNIKSPEKKRKIIGKTFIEIFSGIEEKIGKVLFFAQGTLYPDVIESSSVNGPSATIKSHHNVGGLPKEMNHTLIEPFRELFKDEVREIGRQLGLDEKFIMRHPFPGPGLAVRIIGNITREKVKKLQEADAILIDELHQFGIYNKPWQAFVVLLPVKSVGVMGDERTYENIAVIRMVESVDGMTADWYAAPVEFLKKVSSRIVNEVKGINRVTYDLTSKPPGTIEWE